MASLSDRLTATSLLRAKLSAKGLGVYFHIVALIEQAPNRALKRDLDLISLAVLEDAELVRQVLEDFGLFRLDDTTVQDALDAAPNRPRAESDAAPLRAIPAPDAASNPRREPPTAGRCAARTSPTCVRRREIPSACEPNSALEAASAVPRDPTSQLYDDVRAAWNERFSGTRRVVAEEVPTPIVWENFRSSSSRYGYSDYVEAFRLASRAQFNWQFKDVIKSDNMQRILSSVERPQEPTFEERYFGGIENLPDYAQEFVRNAKERYDRMNQGEEKSNE